MTIARIDRASRLITWGLPMLGLCHAARQVAEEIDRPGLAVLDAVYLAGAYVLAGFGLGALLNALGRWLALQPISVARWAEGFPEAAPSLVAPAQTALDLLKERTTSEIRQAIREGQWEEARTLLDGLATDHQGDPYLTVLHQQLESARVAARDDLMAQLDAARKVNDPDRVLEVHRGLVPLLDSEVKGSLEAELSQWFLRLIHNRLRTGRIQTDVAHLAGRIAETFSHTTEGASLRASLPTLRRSAGLCPRCAQPYTGVADACPSCLGLVPPPSASAN
jgi:hypothetical protein